MEIETRFRCLTPNLLLTPAGGRWVPSANADIRLTGAADHCPSVRHLRGGIFAADVLNELQPDRNSV
jgi:hypothetical protein